MDKGKLLTVIIVDNRTKEFNVYANVVDDFFLTNAVAEAQLAEVDVRSFTTEVAYQKTVEEYEVMGYKFTKRRIV